ncbi:MAG TPA: LysR family transcriptional regulator [Coleofasciculaceae cyanobacterium]
MNLEGIKLSQLRALVTVAEHGNFSEAALHLAVSQSAISHAIATLEDELGVILFSRGRHGATLTPTGERILQIAQQMLGLLDQMGKEANMAKGLEGGEVRLASFRSVATHVLPRAIAQFRQRYPAIAVTLHEFSGCLQVEQELREGRVGIGITCLPAGNEFEAWELLQDEYVVLLPPRYPISEEPLTWEQLSRYPLILPNEEDSCRLQIQQYLNQVEQTLKPTYEVREDSTIVSMVRQGLGIAIMARLAAAPLPDEVQIRPLPVSLKRIIGVATLADAVQPPAVYAFLDTLKDMSRLGQLVVEGSDESRKHQVASITLPDRSGKIRQL